jgi:superfamily II DNA/RNA helicase
VDRLARLSESQRASALEALNHIQTGQYMTLDADEGDTSTTMILPNVRLANGSVKQQTRNILVSAFNMPFFPEVLISSSVLSEGVDLQWECRTIIHHDLDWNPSNLEQRTGRLDRIGSLASKLKKPIDIYQPYTTGLQDEKTFKVVMDRAQWFNIVMGDSVELNEQTINGIAERVPMPEPLKELLSLNLAVSD